MRKTLLKQIARVLCGINMATVYTLLTGRLKKGLRAAAEAYAAARLVDSDGLSAIPCMTLNEITNGRIVEIRMRLGGHDEGMLQSEQLMVLLTILCLENPSVVLEIGTFMGGTTLHLAENCSGAIIHTVDLPLDYVCKKCGGIIPDDEHLIKARQVGKYYRGTSVEQNIQQHYADTANWDFSKVRPCNFFFIDGSHTYEYCLNDSEKCYQICNGKGVFLWHDCDDIHPGVINFINYWRSLGRDIRRFENTSLAYWKSY